MNPPDQKIVSDDMALNYHLMHPGGDSAPGDPNAAFCIEGTYHIHYILRHQWKGDTSYSFVHIISPDMLHWTWQSTKLQPSFTNHGMFSGTGFIAPDGRPAAIYAGLSEPRHTFIAVANDDDLNSWEEPYPLVAEGGPDGNSIDLLGDPDCFLAGDIYYAYSAGNNVPLCKSKDLVHWTYVGPFLKNEMPSVAIGEDLSCANFFQLGNKWFLLCISHSMGCRYYIGDWDATSEQFVPEFHGRMNWRHPGQSLMNPVSRDFFAPESVLTPDGRRVMWAWLCTLNPEIDLKTVQSLPRELSLDEDGTLRIRPLRELESLRHDAVAFSDVVVQAPKGSITPAENSVRIAAIDTDSFEVRITVKRSEAQRRRLGFQLFADDTSEGLLILLRPESGTLCVGETEAPFSVADLPEGEDLDLRIFADKYLVEVFANGRQAALTAFMDFRAGGNILKAYSFAGRGAPPMQIHKVEIWKIRPTNQGFYEARENRIWEPDID